MSDRRHTFTITVTLQGHGADYAEDLVPQVVRAYSLNEALRAALEIPLWEWQEPDDKEVNSQE